MARQFSLPMHLKIVQLLAATTTNGGATSRRFSLANAHKAWIICDLKQAVGNATVVTLNQADAVTAGNTKVAPTTSFNWKNEDCAAADGLTRNANGNAVTLAADIKSKQVIFEILPEDLDWANNYKYAFITIADSTQATNFVSIDAFLADRYIQAVPPTAVT